MLWLGGLWFTNYRGTVLLIVSFEKNYIRCPASVQNDNKDGGYESSAKTNGCYYSSLCNTCLCIKKKSRGHTQTVLDVDVVDDTQTVRPLEE